ncbi:extracellular solute-binding protein [Virgibacillus necropolis]|uniref:ABC transporter substrate-binding protein n=1 Tax=Virgibacillus necropolis TaxID=163877 RepID=UPI0038516357
MNRKLMLFSILVVSVMLVVVGCSEQSSGKDQVELRFLQKWPEPEYSPFFEKVVKEFEKKNPDINIEMEAVGDDPMKDKLRTTVGGGNAPDITFSWSGQFIQKFINAGIALDLTDYLNKDSEWKESFVPASLKPFKSEGKNYGIPIRLVGKFFVYNKQIFDKYNLEEPKDWDEFMAINEKLKSEGVTPIYLGNELPWASIHYLTGLNQKFVPNEKLKSDYNPKSGEFTHEGYIKALKYLKKLNDQGNFNENINSVSHSLALENFYQGKGAMVYIETEGFTRIEENMPVDWGFFPMPDITSGDGNQNFITGAPDGFIVSANSKHPEEAVKFLKFLTSKETQQMMVDMIDWNSSIKGAVTEDNALKQSVEAQNILEEAEGLSQWLDTAVDSRIADVYINNMKPLLNGTKTPEQIMEEVQKEAEKIKSETK